MAMGWEALVVHAATVAAGAGLGFGVEWWRHRQHERGPFARILRTQRHEKTIIVVPRRSHNAGDQHDTTHIHVTFEDMLAANYVDRMLNLAGVRNQDVEVQTVDHFNRTKTLSSREHLVLICSPKANSITALALHDLNTDLSRFGFDIRFEKPIPSEERWQLKFYGATYESPSYKEVDELVKQGVLIEDGVVSDFAIIVRAPHPWAQGKKVLLISGIRGIGTWGAARYFRVNTSSLLKRTKGHDFAALVRVSYSQLQVVNSTLVDVKPILDD